MIASDMVVLVDDDDLLVALLQQDRRGNKPADSRPQNHDRKSLCAIAVIRYRGVLHIILFAAILAKLTLLRKSLGNQ
jgi:hypothetical protein